MRGDAGEDVSQPSLRIDIVHFASDDQAIHGGGSLATSVGSMHMLQATRDVRKVALWLGHASLQSTEAYLRADPTEKLEALAATNAPTLRPGKFRPPDKLIAMLKQQRHL